MLLHRAGPVAAALLGGLQLDQDGQPLVRGLALGDALHQEGAHLAPPAGASSCSSGIMEWAGMSRDTGPEESGTVGVEQREKATLLTTYRVDGSTLWYHLQVSEVRAFSYHSWSRAVVAKPAACRARDRSSSRPTPWPH